MLVAAGVTALAFGLAPGAVGQAGPKPPTVSTCPAAFTIEVFNASNQKSGEYETTEASLRRRFSSGPAYWWDCVYLHSDTGGEAYLVKYDIVPGGQSGQIPSGDCSKQSPDPLRSDTRYLSAHGGPRGVLQRAKGGDRAILLLALRRAEEDGVGAPCAGAAASAPATTTKTIATPKPGASATTLVPVAEKSTQASATFSTGQAVDFAVGFLEKARPPTSSERARIAAKLERLRGIEVVLLTNCAAALTAAGGALSADDVAKGSEKLYPRGLTDTCLRLVAELQERIEKLERTKRRSVAAVSATSKRCLLVSVLVATVRQGGRTRTFVAGRSASPTVAAGCKLATSRLVLTLRRKGSASLQQALGKSLRLTVRRSAKAEAAPGSKLTVSLSQR